MSHYPIILIPPKIQRTRSKLPPKPPFPVLSQPQQPGEEPKKINNTVISVEAAAVTIPSAVMTSQGATIPGLLLFLAGAGAIAAPAWRQITTYPKRKQKHRRKVAVYREKLDERQYFPGKIHTKLTLKIPNFDHPYTPDFAYIDERLNLYIDIEIDEPYVYRTGKPTHYLTSLSLR